MRATTTTTRTTTGVGARRARARAATLARGMNQSPMAEGAIATTLALVLAATPAHALDARATREIVTVSETAFGVDYDAAASKRYDVREKYAKKPTPEPRRFVRPERAEAPAAATPAKAAGGGFSLPSFSLPSLPSLPSLGGDGAAEAPGAEE